MDSKDTPKAKSTVIPYVTGKDVTDAFKVYRSTPKERRSIMKRLLLTPAKVLDMVCDRIPCNWNEAITDTKDRIVKRNKGHKNANKFSLVFKA